MPPRNADAERKALHVNFSKFHRVKTSNSLREKVRKTLVEDTPKVNNPQWLPSNGIPSPRVIQAAIQALNPDANAGFPYLLSGQKKKAYAEGNLPLVVALVQERMARILAFDLELLRRLTPSQLVSAGLMDPLRPIVKNEPHKLQKMREGRYRLVICISVVDEIIDRLLFTTHSTALVGQFAETYSAIGVGFDEDKTAKLVSNVFDRIADSCPIAHSDVSHWEYCCQEEDFDEFAEITIQCTNAPSAAYEKLVRGRCVLLSRGVYVLEDGDLWEQIQPGVNKSGGYQTSRFNTVTRARKSRMVGSVAQMCAGDDCVERVVVGAERRYAKLGVAVRSYTVSADDFDFCSHEYSREGPPIPQNMPKAVVRFIADEPTSDKLMQFVYEYQHAPRLTEAIDALLSTLEADPSDQVEDN